ncbi:MAG TPA: sugar-binding transcriptional regulator [Levilinea sp.]|nr:sugar-binding transcriptional regulator [Levilinea sp.]
MTRVDELRLIARVARMYYEWNMRQAEIARQLGISQATISRLLSRSKLEGIIRISVNIPNGVYTEMEENLVKKYHLRDAIVVDCLEDNETVIQRDIGASAAYYLETVLRPNDVIGISSWSATLLALVDALHHIPAKPAIRVVQILGGVGSPGSEVHAARLTMRLASLLNGKAVFLPAPGVVGSEAAMQVLLQDEYVQEVTALFDQVTLALVGIGAVEPSALLAASGNVFSPHELALLHQQGAVGDILLRFFDRQGHPLDTGLQKRVISMTLEQLSRVDRAIGAAGGARKFVAISGALRGGWVNILVTDQFTAQRLLTE